MVLFINESQIPYQVLSTLTTDVTGNWFLTLLLIYVMIIGLTMMFKMEIEYSSILILPLSLVLMAYTQEFVAIGSAMLLFTGIILAKNFFFRRIGF